MTEATYANRPTSEGRILGREIARLADLAEAEALRAFPTMKPRCRSCAFRAGSVPNGCPPTLMDAVKCLIEVKPFFCHESKDCKELCSGWASFMDVNTRRGNAPWPFSEDAIEAIRSVMTEP